MSDALPRQHPPDVRAYLGRLYAEGRRRHACRAQTQAEFAAWQGPARAAYRELLGLPRIAADAAGHVPRAELGEPGENRGAYVRQRGRLETEPDVTVRFWLLRPRGEGPFPLALTPHGHENGD
ncbi:MAG: hypothetical protein ABIL09_09595, partial [Gemmatimonadota bacterium]